MDIVKAIFSGRKLTVPNLLSFSRLLMIPWFVWTYTVKNNRFATALILLLSGATDILDGFIARRFDQVSNLGKAIDPVADKLTQIAMLLCLTWRQPQLMWALGLLCGKELFVLVTSLLAIRRSGNVLSADWHGKITTAALYGTMILHLLFPQLPKGLSFALTVTCGTLIVLSGILYGRQNLHSAHSAKQETAGCE